jgi:hypothetical protein
MCKVIVFKLVPVVPPSDVTDVTTPVFDSPTTRVDRVPVEESHTERTFVDPNRETYEIAARRSSLPCCGSTWTERA